MKKNKALLMTLVLFCGTLALTGCANLDDAQKMQKYDLGVDSVPSINSVVGEREVTKASSGKENGNPYAQYTYTSASVQDDLAAYLEKLDTDGWRRTLGFNLKGGEETSGKARLEGKSMNSGNILVMDTKYDQNGYTIKVTKKKGTFTPE